MTNTKIKFHGITDRGRETTADSLAEVVDDLAFLARVPPATAVTAQVEGQQKWHVYRSQAALEVDLQRGPITDRSPGWFGIVREVAS